MPQLRVLERVQLLKFTLREIVGQTPEREQMFEANFTCRELSHLANPRLASSEFEDLSGRRFGPRVIRYDL